MASDELTEYIAQQVREHLLTMGLAAPISTLGGPTMEAVYPYGSMPMMTVVPQHPRMMQAGILNAEQRYIASQRLGPSVVEQSLYEPPSMEHAQAFLDVMAPPPPPPPTPVGNSGPMVRVVRPPPPFPQRGEPSKPVMSSTSTAGSERGERKETSGEGQGGRKESSQREEGEFSSQDYRPRSWGGLEESMRVFCAHRRVAGDALTQFKYVLHELQNEYGLLKAYNKDVVAFEHAGHQLLKYTVQGERMEVPVIQGSGRQGSAVSGMGSIVVEATPTRPPPPRSTPMAPPVVPTRGTGESVNSSSAASRGGGGANRSIVYQSSSSGSASDHRGGANNVSVK